MEKKKLLIGALVLSALVFAPNGAQAQVYVQNGVTLNITSGNVNKAQLSNKTLPTSGAVIYNSGTVTITGYSIEDAIKLETNSTGNNGGAIYNTGGASISFSNSELNSNTAQNNGGAIYNGGSSSVTLSGTSLNSNSANNGGAIMNFATLTINGTNNNFVDNKATSGGGSIYNSGNLSATNVNFSNSKEFTGVNAYNGGAIYNYTSKEITQLSSSRFIGNKVTNNGGAIYNAGTIGTGENSVTSLVFEKNQATNGGAIYNAGTIGTADNPATNLTFTDNQATIGGAIATKNELNIANSTFTNNGKDNIGEAYGGAIFIEAGTANVTDSIFNQNQNRSFFDSTANELDKWSMGGAIHVGGELLVSGAITQNDDSTSTYTTQFNGNKSDQGGAISIGKGSNSATVTNVLFDGNEATINGGAIVNYAKATIKGSNFVNNKATTVSQSDKFGGGALFVGSESETTITGSTFSNNSAITGGAIAGRNVDGNNNTGAKLSIEDSVFDSNTATGNGGAIANTFSNTTVTGATFTGNNADGLGGAIYNDGADNTNTLSNIQLATSAFNNNSAISGGAIYNNGDLAITDTSFTNNTATENGGAIFSNKDLTITAATKDVVFSGNSATDGNDIYMNKVEGADTSILALNAGEGKSITLADGISGSDKYNVNVNSDSGNTGSVVLGGTVKNADVSISNGTMDVEKANVTNTTVTVASNASLISNDSSFTNNSATYGGAIYNEGTLKLNKTTISGNSATRYGGAIEATSDSNITITDSIFDSNTASSWGGAIDNDGGKLSIDGSTFSNNEARVGGAIATTNTTIIKNSSFVNNGKDNQSVMGNDGKPQGAFGGALYIDSPDYANKTIIENTVFDSNHNSDSEIGVESSGGAIAIAGFANLAETTFTNNKSDNGGAIMLYRDDQTDVKITGSTFSKNISTISGGAISNYAGNANGENGVYGLTIDNTIFSENQSTEAGQGSGGGAMFLGAKSITKITNSSFDSNTSAGVGGAIASRDYTRGDNHAAKLDIDNTTFTNNTAASDGGAIYNSFYNSQENPNAVTIKNTTFDNNTSGGNGGAIYNEVKDRGGNLAEVSITDTSFINNTAKGNGGAIYANGDLTISAVAKDVIFSGNSATDGNDIYMNKVEDAGTSILALNAGNGTSITLADGVSGNATYDININAPVTGENAVQNTGSIVLGGTVKNANIELSNGTLQLAQAGVLDNSSKLSVLSGATLDSTNNAIETFGNNITLADGVKLAADIDVASTTADNFAAAKIADGAKITVSKVNVVASKADSSSTPMSINILEAMGLSGVATLDSAIVGQSQTVLTPIRYLTGTVVDENGMMNFAPTGSGYRDFNPAIMASPIAAQIGGYLTQLNSYEQAFNTMDMYMLMTSKERQALKLRNKYAAADSHLVFDPTASEYDTLGAWVRPYSTFEKVNLRGGPKVSNVAYGSFFGGESELYDLGNGWDGMYGVYVGYNGSHQAYDGISIYQNGGTLGAVGMAYKGNFFTGLTINVGANAGEASTAYGNDNFSMLMAGIASKTGYNFEFADGKFIIQPSFQISYSFVDTFNYTNAAGARITSSPLNAIQIEPGIKFIGNLKNGWQPYAGVSVIGTIMDKTNFDANDISLPELSIKPYVRYGLGVRKRWGERLSGFGQAFINNGGRNGIGLQAGFRWAIGEGSTGSTKGSVPELKKTQIKLSNGR